MESRTHQTQERTQPTVTTSAQIPSSEQTEQPQREIIQQETPSIQEHQPPPDLQQEQDTEMTPAPTQVTREPQKIRTNDIQPPRATTRSMANAPQLRSTRTKYSLREKPAQKTFKDHLLSQMIIKDNSALAKFLNKQ